ncbi:MAG TPA: tetraacyldisaccharide 4'-kinase [Flavipsychrobacter sp.]|nr:tetraacyldisaccharide 4'-kinase [Flavipsychrobacter sp.]
MNGKNFLYRVFGLIRILLYPLALIYGAIVWLRNKMYDNGLSASIEFAPPVIAVGNLSVGGTGKTPHVEYLIRLLQYQYRVATMSRGYKRTTQGFILADRDSNALRIGDEPMQYHLKFPEAVVSVAEERMTGIPQLLQRRPDIDVILLDDAFQHRSVKAGLNILITDFSKPFYKDHILPFGTLREGRSSYKRADIIMVSKCPADLNKLQSQEIENQIQKKDHQNIYFSEIKYGTPYNFVAGQPLSLAESNAILVCGIARPEPLENHLKTIAKGVHTLSYPDHHYFVTSNLEEIKEAYKNWDVPNKIIVTTEKDAARLHLHMDKLRQWEITIAVLPISVGIMFGKQEEFDRQVLGYVDRVVTENNTI